MKVILLQDVHGVGEAGAVAEVADGYANNYLVPRKLAMPATPGNLKNLEQHRATIRRKQATEMRNAEAMAERISTITLRLKAKAGEAGRLYGSITNAMIAEALAAEHDLEVDRRAISLPHPIRMLGEHEVAIHLHREVNATLKLVVEPEGEEPKAETPKDEGAEAETPEGEEPKQ